jgi:hypothetical protein
LENFHVSEAFQLINENKDCNIFSMLENSEYKLIRKRIIECVLATDMTRHRHGFEYLQLIASKNNINGGQNVNNIMEFLDDNKKNETKQEFLNALLHAADISNPTKPLHVYRQWADLVMAEFWNQGDKEKERGLPFSFLCDRTTTSLSGAQVGFTGGIVQPLFQIITKIFPTLNYMVENIIVNLAYYEKLKNEGKAIEENKTKK